MCSKTSKSLIWRGICLAIALVALAGGVRLWPLHHLGASVTYITFYPAVIIAALYGGLSVGLIATLFSCLTVLFAGTAMFGESFVKDFPFWLGVAVFVINCTIISGIVEAMLRFQSQALEMQLDLKRRNAELKNANIRLEDEIEVRKRAEEAYQAANAYNRRLIEASLDPLLTISSEGKITDVNTATERVTGYSREELIGTDFADYFTDPEKARSGYEQVFRDSLVQDYELTIRHRDGWLTPVMYNASLYRNDSGKAVGIFAAARDISERKRAEEALIRSNEDLQQFAYVASHDLQEPLRNVASCLQMLEKDYKGKLDATADQYIYYAVDSSVRMKALILDLLAYSRVATRGKPPEPVDCEQALDVTLRNLRSAINENGATVTHDLLPAVFGDDSQLLQVFQNLIGNAIKFRRDEPPQIHVSAVKDKNEWVFSVKDNGIGIEPRHLDRIFVIFQRLHKRSQYDGTGMGLAIVKKVVERHGGRVWVESELGVGSTFYFTISDRRIRA